MQKKTFTFGFLIVIGVIVMIAGAISPVTAKPSVGIINKEDLKKELGSNDLVILDVRTGKDWKSSEFKIQGALRANPKEFASWGQNFDKTKKVVLYCA